jgi:hypothetical protein
MPPLEAPEPVVVGAVAAGLLMVFEAVFGLVRPNMKKRPAMRTRAAMPPMIQAV